MILPHSISLQKNISYKLDIPPSPRVPVDLVMVEDVFVATGEAVGLENISPASRINKAVRVFLKAQNLVNQIGLFESGLIVNYDLVRHSTL